MTIPALSPSCLVNRDAAFIKNPLVGSIVLALSTVGSSSPKSSSSSSSPSSCDMVSSMDSISEATGDGSRTGCWRALDRGGIVFDWAFQLDKQTRDALWEDALWGNQDPADHVPVIKPHSKSPSLSNPRVICHTGSSGDY